MKRQRAGLPVELSNDDVLEAMAEIVVKLQKANVNWHDAYVAALHVAGRRVTAQPLRSGYELFPVVVRLAKEQRDAHALLHELEGEPADCPIRECRSAQKDLRAHARLVERLESRETDLDFAIAPIRAGGPPLSEKEVLLPWQRELGSMCHFLHHTGKLTFREIGLLRVLAEGLKPLFKTIHARGGSSKEVARVHGAKRKGRYES